MNQALLDVNVLVALVWPRHEAHQAVQAWFARNARRGWATCPFTQTGFVRTLSNPAFSTDALTPSEATDLLAANLEHPHHKFWADDLGFTDAALPFRVRIVGHRQVTDAYLLGLAVHNRGRMATLDRRVLALLPGDSPLRGSVEVIGQS